VARAAGKSFAPLLLATPFLLAAVMSLLLFPTWRWMPRRLLLTAGWTSTAIMALIGPAACWAMITTLARGLDTGVKDIAIDLGSLSFLRQLAHIRDGRGRRHPLVSVAECESGNGHADVINRFSRGLPCCASRLLVA